MGTASDRPSCDAPTGDVATPTSASEVVLVVALPVSEAGHLDAALVERAGSGDVAVHLLVPARPPDEALSGWGFSEHLGPWSSEAVGFRLARLRLDRALRRLRSLGLAVDGEVGDPDPVTAVRQTLARREVDEILVSAGEAGGRSARAWASALRRIARACEVPVSVVPMAISGTGGPRPVASSPRGRRPRRATRTTA